MSAYTVLAYRADGLDTCRGCVMGRSSSDFEFKVFPTLEEAADYWAAKLYDSLTSAREYCSWDLTLLVDGLDEHAWWEQNPQCDGDTPFDLLYPLHQKRFAELQAAAAEKKRLVEEAAARQKAADQARMRLEAEARELAEFQRLSAKFGPN